MSQNKIVSLEEALEHVNDGTSLMIGGFGDTGIPMDLVHGIIDKGAKDLTIIRNDGGDGEGVMLLVKARRVSKAIVSHLGKTTDMGDQMMAGELEVEYTPQGTLVERIRAGGSGLGGVLTQVGLGTEIQEGKEIVTVDGKDYLLEKPLNADVAIIRAKKADTKGNLYMEGSTKTHGPFMAMASEITIVQADEIVEAGQINPDSVTVPGIFVDYIVQGGQTNV